jgi:DUF4097 and DUF4098 domain-containing protein YvlB
VARAGREEVIVYLLIGSVLAASLVAGPVVAGTRVSESRPASATGAVEVVNVSGSVTVIGWDREEVEVQGELGKGAERLHFEAGPERTTVRVVLPRNCRSCEGSDLTVRVPRRSALEVDAVSATIVVQDVQGVCTLKSVSGDVQVSGDARRVEARSVSGEVRLRVMGGCVRARSVSGNVAIDGAEGSVEASSVSGSIEVKGNALARAELSTTSGSIQLDGSLVAGGKVEAKSVSGDIVVALPGDTVADFEVTTFSGGIRNGFGYEARRVSKYTSEKELTFSTGSGGARVALQSFSGNVVLRKR